MPPDQILIGGATAALCLAGLVKGAWLLEHTHKGQQLVQWCGASAAEWVLRGLLCTGLGFGLLLATGIINPLRFESPPTGPARATQRR